jgi:TRAP-type C4-dicarboxylate transport system permease small subunit
MTFDKLIEAFSDGGATGLAMLAMLLVIVFLIRTIVVSNKQLAELFNKLAEASKVDAEANKTLAIAISRIEAKLDWWPQVSRTPPTDSREPTR